MRTRCTLKSLYVVIKELNVSLIFQPLHGLFWWALQEQERVPLAIYFLAKTPLRRATSRHPAPTIQRRKRAIGVVMGPSLS